MKQCGYCGCENEDGSMHCVECGTELPVTSSQHSGATEPSRPPVQIRESRLLPVDALQNALTPTETFSKPEWQVLWNIIDRTIPLSHRGAAWDEVLMYWLQILQKELGGDYWVCYSSDFAVLSSLPERDARGLLSFAQNALMQIRARLGNLAWASMPGRHVILLFHDEDDYYDYVGGFERGNVIPNSIGMHLSEGYPHVAIKHESDIQNAQTLVHELTHHCLTHLPIPLWLNEGVAQRLQRGIVGVYAPRSHESESSHYWAAVTNWVPPLMWDELAEKHQAFWNEQNIQEFWAGTSFNQPGDSRDLSYSLAEVLVHLLGENREAFLAFLGRAHYDDAGQTAALDCLGTNLGDAVSTFLGPGNWRPYRKAIVQYWEARRTKTPEDAGEGPSLSTQPN